MEIQTRFDMAPVDTAARMVAQSQSFVEGQRVWVPIRQSSEEEWASGVVVGVSRGADEQVTLSVSLVDEPEDAILVPAMQCFLQNEVSDPDDLTRSDYLHEPGILHTLRTRFERDTIYTLSGQVLIALNPNKPLSHLYTPRMIAEYKTGGLDSLHELAPHCYAIAENAYQMMMMDDPARQAILISGESGAGKTFTARMVMSYLAERNGQAGALPIEQQILESNPLLEAFGNAKTTKNENSSRFGKFTEMHFDMGGRVTGAHIETYLLERSRVTSIAGGERGFHIFYQLLSASAEMRDRLLLPLDAGVSTFAYLAPSKTAALEGRSDAEAFAETLNAMRIVGLEEEHIDAVLGVVAAVLHLGNIRFEAAEHAAADEAVLSSDESSSMALANAASLLGTSPDELRRALMSREITVGGEVIVKELSEMECCESRDSLARGLYSKLFEYIVASVNERIGRVSGDERTPQSTGLPGTKTVSILDIYGFESFETNSLEQLCINLANETLQQSFNEHVFKEEQKIYVQEGIDWSRVDFHDNVDVIELMGQVFGLLDEACRLGRVTHKDLAVTMRSKLEGHPRFSAPKRDPATFCINHYAGEVRYDTSADMLERNRDRIGEQHQNLMRTSTQWLPRALYGGVDTEQASHRGAKLATICSIFLKQLDELSNKLCQADRHYIRCIKPAAAPLPGLLEPPYVLDQLRAGGVLEGVRIACQGWPTKLNYLPCARRYICLLAKEDIIKMGIPLTEASGSVDWASLSIKHETAIVAAILSQSGLEGWQLGRTKLFLRAGHLADLEGMRARVWAQYVVCIQSHWRSYAARSRCQQIMRERNAATLIQSMWRARVVRNRYLATRQRLCEEAAAVLIQTIWRMTVARRAFVTQCSFLEDLARQEAAAALQAESEAQLEVSRLAALEAEEARRLAIASENEALKAEVAALKSTLADLEYRLTESISASMTTSASEETHAAAMKALHDKMEQLKVRHADEVAVLTESMSRFGSKEYELALSTKDVEIERLNGQLEAATARLDQLSLELGERDASQAKELRTERDALSKALEHISHLESLLASEKDSVAASNATAQALRNENAIMSSRLDALLQQIERAEIEMSHLKSGQPPAESATHLSLPCSRSASLDDSDRPLSTRESYRLEEDKEHVVTEVVRIIRAPSQQQDTIRLNEVILINLKGWRLRNVFRHLIEDPKWSAQEVVLAADHILFEIGKEAAASFSTCCGLVSTVISSSAMLEADGVGKPPSQHDLYAQIAAKMLGIDSLWASLASFIASKVPIDVASLLREDATKTARLRGSKTLQHEALTFEERFSRCMGSSSGAWLKLVANLDTLMYLLEDTMPPAMAKAIMLCTLRYLDGKLLNFLLMRRDCSVSSARAILTAVAIVESYFASCKLPIATGEFREAMQRTLTAALFISDWWDDAVRQARSGMGEGSALAKCTARGSISHLQLGQIIEARYDDFLPSYGPDTEKNILLAALKSMATSPEADGELLVDCGAEFCLGGGSASWGARNLVRDASIALFSHGDGLSDVDALCAEVDGGGLLW